MSDVSDVTTSARCSPWLATESAGHRRWTRSSASCSDWSPLGLSWRETCCSCWAALEPGGWAGEGGSPLSSVCRGSCSPAPRRSQCSSHWFSPGNSPGPPRTPPVRPTRSPRPGPPPGSGWGRAGRAPPSSLQQVRSGQEERSKEVMKQY